MKIMFVRYPVLLILLIIFLLSGCNASNSLQTKSVPDMIIENYAITNYKNNSVEFILKADKASYYFDEKKSIAENVKLDYHKDEKTSAVVNADRAVIYTDTNDVDLIGSVNIVSTSGNKLITEKIKWHNKDNYLDTDEFVKIIKINGDIIEGTGLAADYNLETYKISNVTASSTSIVDEFEKQNNERTEEKK